MNHTAPQGSILGTDFPDGDINVEACESLLKGVIEAFLLTTNRSFSVAELTIIMASVKLGDTLGMLIWLETINGILCCFGGYTDK